MAKDKLRQEQREKLGQKAVLLAVATVLAALLFTAAAPLVSAGSQAQFPLPKKNPDDKNPQKNLTGQVTGKAGSALYEAVVYLKDKKSLEMKTHITDEKGEFRFSGLDPNADYEVHAEYKGASSNKRSVSSLDGRKDPYLLLEIPTAP